MLFIINPTYLSWPPALVLQDCFLAHISWGIAARTSSSFEETAARCVREEFPMDGQCLWKLRIDVITPTI